MARHVEASPLGFKGIIAAAVVAGLAAGLCVAVFHFALTAPVIEHAVALELASHGGHETAAPVVSRETQRIGLFVGLLLYGAFWALLFGLAFFFGRRALPWSSRVGQGSAAGLLAAWCLGVFPFLKYPANPPGVGEPETIALRQALFLTFLVLSIVGAAIALSLWRISRGRVPWSPVKRALLAVGGYVVFAIVLFMAMPANPDPVHLPAELVGRFRVLSLVGVGLFWLVLGCIFGLMLQRAEGGLLRQPAVRAASTPSRGI